MVRMMWIGLALLVASPAHAWKHVEWAWDKDALPIAYQTTDDGVDLCVSDLEGGVCSAEAAAAFEAWGEATCTDFGGVDAGSSGPAWLGDGTNTVHFGATPVPGVGSYTRFVSSGVVFSINGEDYVEIVEADIAIPRGVDYVSHEDVEAGLCDGRTNLRAALAHEIGHLAGLGHSCDEGEPCTDADLRDALMYYAPDGCDTLYEPQLDDIRGIEALYGPSATAVCGTSGLSSNLGVAPFTLDCEVTGDFDLEQATWSFGDGETATGMVQTHTWEEEGVYTVMVDVAGSDAECGDWETQVIRPGYVRVCEEPRASFHLDHIFGRKYEILNDTPINVVGCITDIRWAIYKGKGIDGEPHDVLENWDFDYEFPQEGHWTVVLNVAGPAGVSAARVTLEAKNRANLSVFGCSHSGPGSGLWALPLVLLGLRRRR